MFEKLKRDVGAVSRGRPGRRFVDWYRCEWQENRKHLLKNVIYIVLGLVLMLIGFILLFIPGPGLLFIFGGIILIVGRVYFFARALDKGELASRKFLKRLFPGKTKKKMNHAEHGEKKEK